jgi:hypothetical protein
MPIDEDKFQSFIKEKCLTCFRRDSPQGRCMLFAEKHAGIENCLGPWKNQEDRMQMIREDFASEEKHADLDRIVRDIALKAFQRKKKIFDE